RRRHTRFDCDWSSDVCSSDLVRYRLLETIRQYASERLNAAAESPVLRDRHLQAYVTLAERAAPELASRREWLDVLDAEAANLERSEERRVGKEGGGREGTGRR